MGASCGSVELAPVVCCPVPAALACGCRPAADPSCLLLLLLRGAAGVPCCSVVLPLGSSTAATPHPSSCRLACRCSLSRLCSHLARTSTSGAHCSAQPDLRGRPVSTGGDSVTSAAAEAAAATKQMLAPLTRTPLAQPLLLQDGPALQCGAEDDVCGRARAAGQGQPRLAVCVHPRRSSRCGR